MKVIIKALKGSEDSLEVKDASITIGDVKEAYESAKKIKISPADKLLFKGKSLKDENTLDSYGIKDGDKLHFIAVTTSGSGKQESFWDKLTTFLLKHFTESDTKKIIECMKQELHRIIHSVSLEVIEQTARTNLELASRT